MFPGLVQILRSRWFAACVHVGLWLLLYLTVVHLKGRAPQYQELEGFSQPAHEVAPVSKLGGLFAAGALPKPRTFTNTLDPFYTLQFAPVAPPLPPPPTTRKFELTYLGFYESAGGPLKVMVKMTNDFLIAPVGGRLLSNLFVAQVSARALILTNPAAQTNLLPLNKAQEVEVPIK